MPAGRKRHRITIQRLKTDAEGLTRAASGKVDRSDPDNWTTHCTRWAEIEETGGREYEQNGQVRGEATHIVAVDFDSVTRTITGEMRVSWDDGGTTRILDITRALGKTRSPAAPRWQRELECKEQL